MSDETTKLTVTPSPLQRTYQWYTSEGHLEEEALPEAPLAKLFRILLRRPLPTRTVYVEDRIVPIEGATGPELVIDREGSHMVRVVVVDKEGDHAPE